MEAGLCAICCGCLYTIFFLFYLAATVASPALATKAMVDMGRSMEDTPALYKWHAGLGYGLLLMSIMRGCRNSFVTGLLRGRKEGDVEGVGQVQMKPSFNCCWELLVSLLGLGMTIGLCVTSFKIYYEHSDAHYKRNDHLFYSAILGMVVSLTALLVIPITICCAFCACCAGVVGGIASLTSRNEL
ncbi:uncharacterized protein LOC129594915 [Paramacrobiotus metropolitanus]|uniref:uncharacterized protein LOC129594915 n=1 Tax=Paramacrobiotus metropolitanus TaxID=2943436 RepID=UPI002445DCA9|nr:uncharacterized protein LOC129594915 [Paramacrobiotus metropolitanus]